MGNPEVRFSRCEAHLQYTILYELISSHCHGVTSISVCIHCVGEKLWIQISWILQKPADLGLHCFQRGCRILKKVAYNGLIRLNTVFEFSKVHIFLILYSTLCHRALLYTAVTKGISYSCYH